MYNRRKKETSAGIHSIRIILALVFILSGFLKAVDPWGSAIKIGEYLSAFGMEWLSGAQYVLAILQAALELWLGLLLLFNQWRTFSRFMVMISMIGFTILTLIIAITNPVSDCGCFGDAIKLTNWQTFFKNLILLPLSVILFLHTPKENAYANHRGEIILIALLLSFFPGISAVYSLPWVDFLPYKIGTNIPAGMYVAPENRGATHTTLLYKNLETEEVQEFELSDTTWYDNTLWEFVDTRIEEIAPSQEPVISNFMIFRHSEDITADILAEEEVFILIADRLEEIGEKEGKKMGNIARFAKEKGIRTICLTTSSLSQEQLLHRKAGISIPCYNIDATTLKTLIRAHYGLIILEKGIIISKKNIRQAPDFEQAGVDSGLEFVIKKEYRNEQIFIFVYILFIFVLFIASCKRNKN